MRPRRTGCTRTSGRGWRRRGAGSRPWCVSCIIASQHMDDRCDFRSGSTDLVAQLENPVLAMARGSCDTCVTDPARVTVTKRGNEAWSDLPCPTIISSRSAVHRDLASAAM